jgi:parallel beta-helix repeat protein
MVIMEDTTFLPGTYYLPNGVSIGAPGVTLDMNGAELVGSDYENYGVSCVGFDDVIIRNGIVRGYYYGMRLQNGLAIQVLDNDLSGNWVDPDSLSPPAPWLNINVGPNLGDRTNLGGGLFVENMAQGTISGNFLNGQENGMDLYFVTDSTISGNDASDNTGWGIHLYGSTGNVVSDNVADNCIRPGLGDSAGFLVVYASDNNEFLNNSFQYGGDGFFIGNENGCPSNYNLIQGNNGSFAGANAFETTFSAGNQFIDNIADGSNYGFWLGYSHSGNVISGNSIRANNTNGIEIEHGQYNTIEGNDIIGNGGKGIVLRTDGLVHFPPAQYPCLNLPDQASSSFYTIRDNIIHSNFGLGLELINTTNSEIVNNLVGGDFGGTASASGADNIWSIRPVEGENIVGGPNLGGNWWSNYTGEDTDGDGLGDTEVPYTNDGQIAAPGDAHPLIGDVDTGELDNPRTLCDHGWEDLGPNTRTTGSTFDTANGAHFATDGVDLYLLEGTNSTRLSRFDFATNRYVSRATAPSTVWDGGDLQYGGGEYYAGVGVQFDTGNGGGKGSYLYVYEPAGNSWNSAPRTSIGGRYYANEALAYDPIDNRLYATIVAYQSGGDPSSIRRLAVYDLMVGAWVGFTSAAADVFEAGSEAEFLDGNIYVWRGGLAGGAVTGSDSYLNVYDIARDTWEQTPPLQSSNVIPGFRSGAFDVWGVGLTAVPARGLLLVMGGESNRQLYVFEVASQTWAVGPTATYDGGWGASIEYVTLSETLYQIDGRNAQGTPQGTAAMRACSAGDLDCDGDLDIGDVDLLVVALLDAESDPCLAARADFNVDGQVNGLDIALFVTLMMGP